MRFDWLTWSNPVSIWWGFLLGATAANIILWLTLYRLSRKRALAFIPGAIRIELMVFLSAAYVFGCGFRSILPRADVQRICLFDTWLSSVVIGRSVATVAELCFAIQWAIVLHHLARLTKCEAARTIALLIVPMILVAEFCSWYAVITTNYLGNTLENLLWAVTFVLIAIGFLLLLNRFAGIVRLAIGSTIVGIVAYVIFMLAVDVPMYFTRWQADVDNGREYLGFFSGLHDVSTRWTVTHNIAEWQEEIVWMSLYFSAAVWASLALGSFGLVQGELQSRMRP